MSGGARHSAIAIGDDAPDSRVATLGMWTFLAADAMGFGALFIAYGVLRVRAHAWPSPRAHLALAPAAAMTFALLASSVTIARAARAAAGRARTAWLGATLALGLGFLAGELVEYHHLLSGAAPIGVSRDLFASTFYALTGYHGLHVLAGLVAALWFAGGRTGGRRLDVLALYWHFVDLAWMPIFSLVYLLPSR